MKRFGNSFKLCIGLSVVMALLSVLFILLVLNFLILIGQAEPNPHFESFKDYFLLFWLFFGVLVLCLLPTTSSWVFVDVEKIKIYRFYRLKRVVQVSDVRDFSEHLSQPAYRLNLKDGSYVEVPAMSIFGIYSLKRYLWIEHHIQFFKWRIGGRRH